MANRRFVQRAARRPTFWQGASLAGTVPTGTSIAGAIITESQLENVPNPTIVRIRGSIMITTILAGVAGARANIFCGIKLVTASAFSSGTHQQPFTDAGSDWIWWTTAAMHLVGGTVATPSVDGGTLFKRIEIDSKAMRKVPINSLLAIVVENLALVSTMTIEFGGGTRVLLKR